MIARSLRIVLPVCAALLPLPIETAAQRPHGIAPGQAKKATQPAGQQPVRSSSDAGSSPVETGLSGDYPVRTLAAWLDDASVVGARQAWATLSASSWRMPIATGVDAPVIDLLFGHSDRVQTSVTLPYYRIRTPETTGGFGDIYLSTKVRLRDSAAGLGIAVSPTLEVVNTSMVNAGVSRFNLVLPVSLEQSFGRTRVYGSAGYFTRGSLFGGIAVERTLNTRTWITGALTHAYATGSEIVSEEIGLARRRTDISGGVGYAIAPTVIAFGSLARTIAGRDPDSTSVVATGGVSVRLSRK